MSLPQLSLSAARNLHLAAQGLLKSPAVARSLPIFYLPYSACRYSRSIPLILWHVALTVLFSRTGSYPSQWLDEALSKGS